MRHGQNCASIAMVLAAILVSGCARLDDAGMFVLSSNLEAVAIVGGQVLQGEAVLLPDRTGNVKLETTGGLIASCMGMLRFSAKNSGSIDLHCNDGSTTDLAFSMLGPTTGYAYGSAASGTASLVFGMNSTQARAYLKVPSGKQLIDQKGPPMFDLQ